MRLGKLNNQKNQIITKFLRNAKMFQKTLRRTWRKNKGLIKPIEAPLQEETQPHQQLLQVYLRLQEVLENLSTHWPTLMQNLFQLPPN